MGLLDDAIREHLELKRLRGADPGEVAREQREALDPVPRRGEEQPAEDLSVEHRDGAQPVRDDDFSNIGQETAELDMRAVLDDASGTPDFGAPGVHTASDPEGTVAGPAGVASDANEPPAEDSLEWEVPSSGSHEHGMPGGPTDAADIDPLGPGEAHGEGASGEVEDEDVLEETPDFLRDTPEQERLWFEQRPPRDFDFDK